MVLVAALQQCDVSLRLGIATNGPLVPSMIFRSRITKQSSNVIEQNACSRSPALVHELDPNFGDFHVCSPCFFCQFGPATANTCREPTAAQGGRQPPGVFCMPTDAEVGTAATCHLMP